MQAEMPFYECPEDALKAVVQVLGGAKQVGPMLWPDKTVDNAARGLLDCLNPARAEKLELTQIMRIFALAKEVGAHAPFAWFASEAGYEAKPITPAKEVDRLTHVIEQSSHVLTHAIAALERIKKSGAV